MPIRCVNDDEVLSIRVDKRRIAIDLYWEFDANNGDVSVGSVELILLLDLKFA